MAVVRDAIDSIMHRRCSAQPDSDLFATIGSFALTNAEISAGVIPTNYTYPPLHAWRYGADPTGVVDSTQSLTRWINVINQSGGLPSQSFRSAYLPGGLYLITAGLPPITASKLSIHGDGSDVSRINVSGQGFTVLQIGGNVPTAVTISNVTIQGIGIFRLGGTNIVTTLMKIIGSQFGVFRDITLYDNTQVGGGVGLEYRGHENNTFENLVIQNVNPILLGNPSGTNGDGCDHTTFNGLELTSSTDTQPLIALLINSGPYVSTGLSNLQFIGNQVWLGGSHGFYWNDTGAGHGLSIGGNLLFENIRREQTSSSSSGETIYIRTGGSSGGGSNDAITNVVVRNCTFGLPSSAQGGMYFEGANFVTLENVFSSIGPGVGISMLARTGNTQIQLITINCSLDPAASNLTNLERVFGSDDIIVGATQNPATCIYQYTDANNQNLRGMRIYEARKWLGSRSVSNGSNFIIPSSSSGTGIATIGASVGSGNIEGGVIICSGSATQLVSGTTNVVAAVTAGKLSISWNAGANSYVVTNNLGSTRTIIVSVEWL